MRGALLCVSLPPRPLADHHRAGLDPHRAPTRTHVAGSAGVEPRIVETVGHRGKAAAVLAGLLEPLHLARHDDALARAQCQLPARTGRLAEAAFDAEIDDRVT